MNDENRTAVRKLERGDLVLVTGRIKSLDRSDGLVEVSILDGDLPVVAHVFIWAKSLKRRPKS